MQPDGLFDFIFEVCLILWDEFRFLHEFDKFVDYLVLDAL